MERHTHRWSGHLPRYTRTWQTWSTHQCYRIISLQFSSTTRTWPCPIWRASFSPRVSRSSFNSIRISPWSQKMKILWKTITTSVRVDFLKPSKWSPTPKPIYPPDSPSPRAYVSTPACKSTSPQTPSSIKAKSSMGLSLSTWKPTSHHSSCKLKRRTNLPLSSVLCLISRLKTSRSQRNHSVQTLSAL